MWSRCIYQIHLSALHQFLTNLPFPFSTSIQCRVIFYPFFFKGELLFVVNYQQCVQCFELLISFLHCMTFKVFFLLLTSCSFPYTAFLKLLINSLASPNEVKMYKKMALFVIVLLYFWLCSVWLHRDCCLGSIIQQMAENRMKMCQD